MLTLNAALDPHRKWAESRNRVRSMETCHFTTGP